MAISQVVGLFDDPAALERARTALIEAGVAGEDMIRIEPEKPGQSVQQHREHRGILHRLKELLTGHSDDDVRAYAEGVRRGGMLLVVAVPEEQAEAVREILRKSGAAEIRRRVRRWIAMSPGPVGFEPEGLAFTEEEIAEERRCIALETAEALAEADDHRDETRNIRLLDEATGREIGRISDEELAVLQEVLEDEGPDDQDYWINLDEVAEIACRPGATPHLIALLHNAVRDKPDGIDIAFQRDGEERQSLRRTAGSSRGTPSP
jgi:hypothetical protein